MDTSMKRGMGVLLVVAATCLVFWPGAASADSTVSIKDFAYGPATIQVAVGETVTWTNEEEIMPHDVTSGTAGGSDVGQVFASEFLMPGQSFSTTFSAPGEYPYLCVLHPAMVGVVIVN